MGVDYLGLKTSIRRNLTRRTRQTLKPDTICKFCDKTKFNVYNKNDSVCSMLPHLETTRGGQVVLGRVKTLAKYKYDKCSLFTTLTLPYEYEAKPGNLYWTIKINDLFMYCAVRRRKALPIRLVIDPKPLTSKNKVTSKTVTWREEQQLLRFFKMYKYKSLTHPGVFFFSKLPHVRFKNIVRVF
jgi:hypothetical protein